MSHDLSNKIVKISFIKSMQLLLLVNLFCLRAKFTRDRYTVASERGMDEKPISFHTAQRCQKSSRDDLAGGKSMSPYACFSGMFHVRPFHGLGRKVCWFVSPCRIPKAT